MVVSFEWLPMILKKWGVILIENTWKRAEYETWDEAFRGMIAAVRQQSVRVASYTQAIYLQACEDPNYKKGISDADDRIKTQYGDLAYKCGLYHQLGKALVPPEYQLWREDFTEEEIAVYRKYTTDGRALVATLQLRGQKAKEKRRMDTTAEVPTQNIPWMMLRETCEQHMERWNGSGYPVGLSGNRISAIAQIVGIAKELDRLASETKSEKPFDDAYEILLAQENELWSPALIRVLKNAKQKCRGIYNKYIHYTMTLPKTVPLVERRADRPMGLSYRPMIAEKDGKPVAYEAIPWFGAIANRPGETETMEDIHEMLVRTDMVGDMAFYFLYEAADTVLRMQNCKLKTNGILLHMLPGFYSLGTQLQRFTQLYEDQPIDKAKLMITLPEETFLKINKAQKEIVGRYLRAGVSIVLDGYHPDKYDYKDLIKLGFRHVRIAPELYLQRETAALMQTLRDNGFILIGGGADTHDLLAWQVACGTTAISGTLSGVPVTEDELIRDCLLADR